jgi:FkbM family methyltransferase
MNDAPEMLGEIEQAVQRAVAAQLQPLKSELAELQKAAAASRSLLALYQTFRYAFFKGKNGPLSVPNIDFLVFNALLNDIRFVRYEPETKRMVLTKDGMLFATDAYFYVLAELFAYEEYREFRRLVDRPFVVYDVGMNRGYAALWFANHPHCRTVYGFEILEAPYQWALINFALNPQLSAKIQPFCFGLGDKDKTVEILYENATDGVSTTMPEFFDSYWTPQRKAQARKKAVPVRKASEVIASLPAVNPGDLRVLKIDVEGAEYEILEELGQANRLDFDIILAEAHLGLDKFLALTPAYRVVEVVRHSDLMANVVLARERKS